MATNDKPYTPPAVEEVQAEPLVDFTCVTGH